MNNPKTNRVCLSNSYCRTLSFSDAPTVGILSSYYEAFMNDDNTWEVFHIEEHPCPKIGQPVASQTHAHTRYSFEDVLQKFYVWENGARAFQCIFTNTRDDFGLDHFHTLAHAEGLAFDSNGNVVETREGRIVSAGQFTVAEKQLARQDHLNPVPPKQLERPALSDIFCINAEEQKMPDLKSVLESKIELQNQVNFYEALLLDLTKIELDITKIILILDKILLKIQPDKNKLDFSNVGSNTDWSILDGKTITKKSFPHEHGREIFSEGGYIKFGPVRLDDFEEAFKRAQELKKILIPEHIVDLFRELRFFGSYLHLKGIFHWDAVETENSEMKKKAFEISREILGEDYIRLPSYLEKPALSIVEKLIASKTPEKSPQIFDRIKAEIEKLIEFHKGNLADFENLVENRTPPKQLKATPK